MIFYVYFLYQFATLAQLVEQRFCKAKVPGSNPGGGSMNILVTGHRGFIGGYLWKALGDVKKIGIDKKEGNDILNTPLPDVDCIYHLAAQVDVGSSITDPMGDARDNILATIAIAKKYPQTRIIYTASAASLNITSPYGLSKKTAADYIKLFCKNYVIVTLPNLFGEGGRGVLEIFKNNDTCTIFGDGTQTRDFVHVEDIAQMLCMAREWPVGEYECGSGSSTTILECARMTGKKIVFAPVREGDIYESVMHNTTPNWIPQIKITDYLK